MTEKYNDLIQCPKCGKMELDHEMGDFGWSSCEFYCYACRAKLDWEELTALIRQKRETLEKTLNDNIQFFKDRPLETFPSGRIENILTFLKEELNK